MWEYGYSSELYHHGVKGQRWGVRKVDRLKSKRNKYRSKQQEYERSGNSEKAQKYNKKVTKTNYKIDVMRDANDFNSKRSTGAKVVTNLLAGTFANTTYASARNQGMTKVGASAYTFLTASLLGNSIAAMEITRLSDRRGRERKEYNKE